VEAAHEATIASGSLPTLVVRTVTEEKNSDPSAPPPFEVLIEATTAVRHARPHGKRFGILVHAMLASIPLDGDSTAIADVARVQARILVRKRGGGR
jgi:hypothetical protein